MRLFAAIQFSPAVKSALLEAIAALRAGDGVTLLAPRQKLASSAIAIAASSSARMVRFRDMGFSPLCNKKSRATPGRSLRKKRGKARLARSCISFLSPKNSIRGLRAGLLTRDHRPARPSRRRPVALRAALPLTAAVLSEIFTPFPFHPCNAWAPADADGA